MKKVTLLLMMAVFAISTAFAGNANLFTYNQDELNQEFEQLNALEGYVLANQGAAITDVENNPLFGTMDFSGMKHSSPMGAMFSIDDMDWAAFAWGLVCCPVGFFVVAIDDDSSKEEKMSYWIGVVIFMVFGGGSGGVLL